MRFVMLLLLQNPSHASAQPEYFVESIVLQSGKNRAVPIVITVICIKREHLTDFVKTINRTSPAMKLGGGGLETKNRVSSL